MTEVNTGDRVVVSVTATDSGDWQVVSVPTGFEGITSTLFAENDFLHGFVRHEDGEQWEVYDFDGGDDSKLLQVTSISGTVTLARPATPWKSNRSDGARMDAGSGTHTMTLSLGSGTLKRIFRELSPFWKTFTSADASPSVAGYSKFKTNGTTPIVRFDDMTNGGRFLVRRGGSDIVITHDGTNIDLFGAANVTLTAASPSIEFAVESGVAKQIGGNLAPLDEDDFATNSATRSPSQQSAKAYIDAGLSPKATATAKLYGHTPAVEFTGSTGAVLASAIAANPNLRISTPFSNTSTAVTLPLGKSLEFEAGASLSSSGSGSFTNQGTLIRTNYNPDNWTAWDQDLGVVNNNYEGFSVEVGPYGPRTCVGLWNTPNAISGAMNVPSNAEYNPTGGSIVHGAGVGGWVKNASQNCGAVALYGQAERDDSGNVLVWGLNTVTYDRGNGGSNVWGYELDINVDDATTTVLGIDMVGGSTVEPALAIAFHVQPLGVFESTPKRWTYTLLSRDGAAQIGVELGATLGTLSAPQPIQAYYVDGSAARQKAYTLGGDSSGNTFLRSEQNDKIIALQGRHSGSVTPGVVVVGNNVGINNSGIPAFPADIVGALKFSPGTSVTPPSNGDVVFDVPDNYHFRTIEKGSDGTVRNNVQPLYSGNREVGIRLLFELAVADMHTLADQPFTKIGNFTTWTIVANGGIRISWTGGNPSDAIGGIYTAASKGGAQLLASSTTYTGLTAAGNGASGSIVAGNAGDRTETPILSLSTASTAAGSCVFRIFGLALD